MKLKFFSNLSLFRLIIIFKYLEFIWLIIYRLFTLEAKNKKNTIIIVMAESSHYIYIPLISINIS